MQDVFNKQINLQLVFTGLNKWNKFKQSEESKITLTNTNGSMYKSHTVASKPLRLYRQSIELK